MINESNIKANTGAGALNTEVATELVTELATDKWAGNEAVSGLAEEKNWNLLRDSLRKALGESDFRSWLHPLYLFACDSDRVTLAAPSRFVRDWVQSNYLETLLKSWRDLNGQILLVEVVVRAPRLKQSPLGKGQSSVASTLASSTPDKQVTDKPNPAQDLSIDRISSPLDPTYTLNSFVVAPPNELAVAAVKRVVESDGPTFNPLVIYGGVGLGKTHLLQALAWGIREKQPNKRVGYISAEKFLYSFVRAIRSKATEHFKNAIRDLDVLLIDDMQYISSGEATQEEFVQTFNALFDRNRQVVVAVNRPPSQLEQLDERLRSRLMGGLAIDLQPTTESLRLSVLKQKSGVAAGLISDEVLSFVAAKINSNIRELEGALNRLIAHATLMNQPVSLELAQSVLRDLLSAHERRINIDEIQKRVSKYFEIRQSDLLSQRRARQVARPRQIAMYLAKHLTSRSLPEIGRSFGGRDHTTVMHAIKRIEALSNEDPQVGEDLAQLKLELGA
ncbi:MAG: chromosomal replication initiator protein DnaA [Alphaproteobacteria bacterium]